MYQPTKTVIQTVTLHPLCDSPDAVTIALVAQRAPEWVIQPVIDSSLLFSALNHYAASALSSEIELVLSDLEQYLSEGGDVEKWKPPISGVETDGFVLDVDAPLDDVARSASATTSFWSSALAR